MHWGIDGPDDILHAVPGIRLLDWVSTFDSDAFQRVPARYRLTAKVMSSVAALRYMSQYHRYGFGTT